MDAPLVLDLIASAAAAVTPAAGSLLDVGCGAGNYTLKMLQRLPDLNVTLIDLSRPMLDRAQLRLAPVARGRVELIQGEIRQVELPEGRFDIILAACILHHLRTDDQWRSVFAKFCWALATGGSIWISNMVRHTLAPVQADMEMRYAQYLANLKGPEYRDTALAYSEKEDTPHSLMFQLDLLREVGFTKVELLHKNAVFAAFGAMKE